MNIVLLLLSSTKHIFSNTLGSTKTNFQNFLSSLKQKRCISITSSHFHLYLKSSQKKTQVNEASLVEQVCHPSHLIPYNCRNLVFLLRTPLDPWECHRGRLLGLLPWLSSKTPTFWVAARPSALVVVQTNGNVQW